MDYNNDQTAWLLDQDAARNELRDIEQTERIAKEQLQRMAKRFMARFAQKHGHQTKAQLAQELQ